MELNTTVVSGGRRSRHEPSVDMNTTEGEIKRQKILASDSTLAVPDKVLRLSLMCYVLEMELASIWEHLAAEDVSNLLQVCLVGLSQAFADKHETHFGNHYGCDWMRKLNFFARSKDQCFKDLPYVVDKTLSVLQIAGGAKHLLNALVLVGRLRQLLRRHSWAVFVPVVYPLLEKDELSLIPCTDDAVRLAMNRSHKLAGERFFYKFKRKREQATPDYLDHHWDNIEGLSCQYCDSVIKSREPLNDTEKRDISFNCTTVYRPMKIHMMNDLQFVRFIPRPRRLIKIPVSPRSYQGMVAGVSRDGILCGFYLASS